VVRLWILVPASGVRIPPSQPDRDDERFAPSNTPVVGVFFSGLVSHFVPFSIFLVCRIFSAITFANSVYVTDREPPL
jgi:hypothetical protein